MKASESRPGEKGEDISSLVNAFRYFNETATTLTASYRRLEARIELLTGELDEKDRQLYSRLRELDRVTKYLSSLLESISSGVIAIDLEGQITMFNRTAAEMTGIDAESTIGKPYEEVMGTNNLDTSAYYTLQNGPEIRGVEKLLPGRGLQVETSTTWVVDSLGERVGVVELFDDVSIIRRMEERFEQQKTLSALGEMAAAVAHELRNPLSGIGGFAALLREEMEDDPNSLRLIDKIIQGVHDLERLSGNLLFLTRPTEVKRDTVDLKAAITDLVELLQAEARGKKPRAVIRAQLPDENIPITADRELTRMILTNLGRNALQAIDDEGEITFDLTWRLLVNRVVVTVEDTGCGIDPENIKRLFNPFFTTRADGTGLGLALVKKAAELQKGEVRVDSKPGEGSRFTLILPIRSFTPSQDAAQDDNHAEQDDNTTGKDSQD